MGKAKELRKRPNAKKDAQKAVGKIFGDPTGKKTEAELEEEFNKKVELWCGRIIRGVFMSYSLFGALASAVEWATRPDMPPLVPIGGGDDLAGVNAIVTGGCGGMGLELTRGLAMRGANVVAGCRAPKPPLPDDADADFGSSSGDELLDSLLDPTTIEGIPEGSVRGSAVRHELDLEDFSSVRAFATKALAEHEGKVDVLIHAAGSMRACENTTDGFESATQVNYLSPVLLNRLVTPRLADRAGSSFKPLGNARVVHVTCSSAASMGGKGADADGVLLASDGVKPRKKGCDPGSRYADSKILLERHARVLARKFDKKNVLVAAVDPGDMLTDYVLKANWRRGGMRYHPAAIVSWAVGKASTAAFGPHGFGSFTKRQPERGAAAVAHVAVGDVFRNVAGTGAGGRVFSDRAGAFTRATGCAREVEHECGVVREPGPKRSEDARVHEAKALKRDETDSEVWKMTSKVLAPWSGELE